MFICQITGKNSRQGDPRTGELYHISDTEKMDTKGSEKLNRIVVQTREKTYFRKMKNEETGKWEDVEVGHGWEIVREIDASDEGLAIWNSWSEFDRANFVDNLNH